MRSFPGACGEAAIGAGSPGRRRRRPLPARGRRHAFCRLVTLVACLVLWLPGLGASPAGASPGTGNRAWDVYVASDARLGAGVVPVIDTAANAVTATLRAGNEPVSVAFTPGATRAYVVNTFTGDVSVVDTASSAVIATIGVGVFPMGIAITPNGRRAYVANDSSHDVSVIDTATNKVTATIGHLGPEPAWVTITPDGTKAYVIDPQSPNVLIIDTAANKVTGVINTRDPYGLVSLAVTPDGSTLYVVGGHRVHVISTATDSVIGSIAVKGAPDWVPHWISISPDGETAYVATDYLFGPSSRIALVATATNRITGSIRVPLLPDVTGGVSFTPDGKFGYAPLFDRSVAVIDTSRRVIAGTIAVRGSPQLAAVTPDQAPVARLAVASAPAGRRTRLNASASTVRYGTIARYAWKFGDGISAVTATPVTGHVYAGPGRYTVTVTETSSGGTSTTRVFTGTSVIRNGGPSAVAAAVATIRARAQASSARRARAPGVLVPAG